jgi:6-phosphogluconolactonase
MRFRSLALLLTVSVFVWLWSSCDSKGGTTNGGRGTVGPGTTATYIVYSDGARVGVQSINPNGTITPILGSPYQAGSNPSNVVVTPDGKFIYVVNKGSNSITQYSITSTGTLNTIAVDISTGTLPVSIAVDASQKFVAVANQTSGNLSIYSISPSGALAPFSTSPMLTGNNPVAVAIRGNNVYAVGPNSIAVIAVDPVNFTLTPATGSPFAAGNVGALTAASAGRQLYALDSTRNDVQEYTLDITTGIPTIGASIAAGSNPTAVLQVLSGRFLYVANKASNNVSGYSIDPNTGELTAVAGSPFTAGTGPASLAFDSTNNLLLVGNNTSADLSVYTVNTTTGVLTAVGTATNLGGAVNSASVATP